MSEEANAMMQEPTGGQRSIFSRIVRFIFRLLVVIIIGAVLGVAVYYAVPAIYRTAIEPVQTNTQSIIDLERDIIQLQTTADMQAEQYADRLAEVEGRLTAKGEEIAALQAEVAALQTAFESQQQEVSDLKPLLRQVERLTSDLETTEDQVAFLEETLTGIELPAERLERQIQMIRAMTMLTQARLWLLQDNLGLAAEEITNARTLIAEVAEAEPEEENELYLQILDRLDLALEDVRTTPIIAAEELEIAWRLLVEVTTTESPVLETTTSE
jgi:chromosome segregation ATPase